MAKFTVEQAADVIAVQQVINEWGDELDQNSGLKILEADVLTEDCRYNVGGEMREGRAAAAKFYVDRAERLKAAGGMPVMRHVHTNFRVSITGADTARANFMLLFFVGAGEPPFLGAACDPVALAEVWMDCRRDADGQWRISSFDSVQTFRRT